MNSLVGICTDTQPAISRGVVVVVMVVAVVMVVTVGVVAVAMCLLQHVFHVSALQRMQLYIALPRMAHTTVCASEPRTLP